MTPDNPALLLGFEQHKKLNVEGGGTTSDLRKGQKQGDLEIWDPVDQVPSYRVREV